MYVKSFVFAVGLVTLTGCAGTLAIPALGLDHPANPWAAAAPVPVAPTVPHSTLRASAKASPQAAMAGMEGMQGMQEMNHGPMQGMDHGSMQGMDHGSMEGMEGMQGMSHGAHVDEHGEPAAGRPGTENQVDRTVKVAVFDAMRYKPQSLTVKPGETIRFVVTNAGKIRHEFVIATAEEQREHDAMMRKMPNMVHHDPNALTLAPGDTKTLSWQFGQPGTVQFACHVPGHYQAGMIGKVTVGTAGTPSEAQMKMNMDDMQGMGQGSMQDMKGMQRMKDMKSMEGMHHGH